MTASVLLRPLLLCLVLLQHSICLGQDSVSHSKHSSHPPCKNQKGIKRNSNTCQCGATSICNLKKNIIGSYCRSNEFPSCVDRLNADVTRTIKFNANSNTTCKQAQLKSSAWSDSITKDPNTCTFTGPKCLENLVNETCACGTTVCSPFQGMKCNVQTNKCSFADPCSNQDGTESNGIKTCSCGSTHCTAYTGMYCRNQEQLGLPKLRLPCVQSKLPICENRLNSIPNKDENGCECGNGDFSQSTICVKFNQDFPGSGMICHGLENRCSQSECSGQAISNMNTTDTCATWTPRCTCSQCTQGNFGSICEPCPADPTIGWIADICTIILGVYIFTGILYYTFRPANKKFKAQAIRSKRQMTQLAKVTSMGSTMISVLVGQFQIISVIIGTIAWSPSLPAWLTDFLTLLGSVFSIDFVGIFSSFECGDTTTPLTRWYVSLMMPFCLMFLFLVWFLCCEIWFRYLKKDGTPENNLHALDITYEIIVEAGVNILLIGIYKTVASSTFQIFDCTPFYDKNGNDVIARLILDPNIVCPYALAIGKTLPGFADADITPCIIGGIIFLVWCIIPFIIINYALIDAVSDTDAGGKSIEELQSTDRNFRLKFGWAINKYRTYAHPWETKIVGDNRRKYIFLTACAWESFNSVIKLVVVAGAELMFARERFFWMTAILSLSIFMHWLIRPFRDVSCNIMVVLFGICDILGVICNPTIDTDATNGASSSPSINHLNGTNETMSDDMSRMEIMKSRAGAIYDSANQDGFTLQIIFLVCICLTTTSAIYLVIAAVLKVIRDRSRKQKMELIRKQVEADLFEGDIVAKRRMEEEIRKSKATFSRCEIILIFPTWAFIYLIKKTVSIAVDHKKKQHLQQQMKDNMRRKNHKGAMKRHGTHIHQPHMSAERNHCLHVWIEWALLWPVKHILRGWIYMLENIEHTPCCKPFCMKDTRHHGGHHTMYDHLIDEGPKGHPMGKNEYKVDAKTLEFIGFTWNTNVIQPMNKPNDATLCCQIKTLDSDGKADLAGIEEGDIVIGIHSEKFTHIIKPGADAAKHAQAMLKEAIKPITFTILREADPERILRWEIEQGLKAAPKKQKIDMNLNKEFLNLRCIEIFEQYDFGNKGWLSKDETRIAYWNALGEDVTDDAFDYEFLKMDKDANEQISREEFKNGFFRELLFKELDADKNGRISKAELKYCFEQFHMDFESLENEDFEIMFDSMVLEGETDVSLASFKKRLFHTQKKGTKNKNSSSTKISPSNYVAEDADSDGSEDEEDDDGCIDTDEEDEHEEDEKDDESVDEDGGGGHMFTRKVTKKTDTSGVHL